MLCPNLPTNCFCNCVSASLLVIPLYSRQFWRLVLMRHREKDLLVKKTFLFLSNVAKISSYSFDLRIHLIKFLHLIRSIDVCLLVNRVVNWLRCEFSRKPFLCFSLPCVGVIETVQYTLPRIASLEKGRLT